MRIINFGRINITYYISNQKNIQNYHTYKYIDKKYLVLIIHIIISEFR